MRNTLATIAVTAILVTVPLSAFATEDVPDTSFPIGVTPALPEPLPTCGPNQELQPNGEDDGAGYQCGCIDTYLMAEDGSCVPPSYYDVQLPTLDIPVSTPEPVVESADYPLTSVAFPERVIPINTVRTIPNWVLQAI